MRCLIAALAAAFMLTGCAAIQAAKTQQALDPALVQKDLDTANYLLRAAGCVTQEVSTAAAPVVAIAADQQGNKVLSAVNAAGTVNCSITVPVTALPSGQVAPAAAPAAAPAK